MVIWVVDFGKWPLYAHILHLYIQAFMQNKTWARQDLIRYYE